jgi:hypothetical protein
LTVAISQQKLFKFGNGFCWIGDLAFVAAYPTNGESVSIPLRNVFDVAFCGENLGYIFKYDRTNKKVKVYTPQSPFLACEEAVVVASNAGTLAHVPLYIVAVQVTAGTTTGAFSVIPNGETPLTKQVAVNFTTGALTFLASDEVTAVKVTYIPKHGSGYLNSVTVDETVTASASKVNLAARAGLIQYVWDDIDGILCSFEQPGAVPSATHFCTVDINDSGNTSIDSHADDAGNTLKVTYVPYSALPPGCFIDDTDITLSSEAWNFTGDPGVVGYNNLIVPGFGVNLIGETAATARSAAVWEGPSGTAANGVATWNPAKNSILTDQTTAMTIASIPWMILSPLLLTPPSIPEEVANGVDLSALTAVRIIAFGY